MKERFEGTQNRALLVAALRRQDFAGGSQDIANALADAGELCEYRPGENIIVQGGADNEIYLLVAGVVAITVNGAQVAVRSAGQHVGEMAAIEPSLLRSATVTTLEPSVLLKLSSTAFLDVGQRFPALWLPIAQELSRRLLQRNKTIYPPNKAAKLFIMSSSESLKVAHALRAGLEKDVFSTVWDDGVFFAGGYTLEALEKQVSESDFAVAIAEPDDISESRGRRAPTVRDNVLFELGLFMGKLTRYRTILVHPRIKDLKLPSDLQGLTLVSYDAGEEATISSRISPACDTIRELVRRLGVRTFAIEKGR
ncbi:TIR domain-containing protein [Bradyrhizobium sp. CCBAU 53421]|uniref:TIR domain-containing protein n=1 Tax=Bradyrhizobium sp. CCBAU 53421 TaxID=1325120 RepID=UPI00188D6E39|nr:TIR domain-containing protein [Bradyrhizobium sp. CCBAU 53421]QOZ36359.1 cyclic nucleotide-binding protein [Bradyrhizobium sp. CCBAU 53421]